MPELSATEFPSVEVDGTQLRIYRTGDIGVLDHAGILHFRGRQDRQVKITGHRVEMAEIEITVRGLAGIRDCVALPLTTLDGQVSRLALFYLSEPGSQYGPGGDEGDRLAVRDQLLRHLPGYLVPGVVCGLARFPLTANGKLDRPTLMQLAQRSRPVRGHAR
jgi:D-alanine--poly(phosphoribitol) ligase subunit 1